MTIRERLVQDINHIQNPVLLNQILEFVHLVSRRTKPKKGNIHRLLKHAGALADEDAQEIRKIVDEEFNHIEGDW